MIENHILQGARFQQTPNISPGAITHKYLIIHYSASGSTDGTVRELCKSGSNKSAHLVIGRDGEIVQLASFDQQAWHCGESKWENDEGLNRMSIGIELVNWGPVDLSKDGKYRSWVGTEIPPNEVEQATHKNETGPRYWHKYTPEQLEVCANVAAQIFRTYNLKAILGHDDIAPTRKTDPGPLFPMESLRERIQAQKDLPGFIDSETGLYYLSETVYSANEARELRDWLNENLPE